MTAILLLLIGGATAIGVAGGSPAQAETPNCSSGQIPGGPSSAPGPAPALNESLTIVQSSTTTGLAPGMPPSAITGVITNHGRSSALVTTVTVQVTAVTKAAAATAGACAASDYVLLDAVMPVGLTLAPGGSADFGGARIGFNNKSTNQDACQRAVVSLSYVSA